MVERTVHQKEIDWRSLTKKNGIDVQRCYFCGKELADASTNYVQITTPEGKEILGCVSHPGVTQEYNKQQADKEGEERCK